MHLTFGDRVGKIGCDEIGGCTGPAVSRHQDLGLTRYPVVRYERPKELQAVIPGNRESLVVPLETHHQIGCELTGIAGTVQYKEYDRGVTDLLGTDGHGCRCHGRLLGEILVHHGIPTAHVPEESEDRCRLILHILGIVSAGQFQTQSEHHQIRVVLRRRMTKETVTVVDRHLRVILQCIVIGLVSETFGLPLFFRIVVDHDDSNR